jgi:Rrf2 family protein
MQLTRAADYAVRVMIHLAALPPGTRVSRSELSTAAECPEQFLCKVLQSLARAGLIVSHRGNTGGFELQESHRSASLLQVVEAIEGPLHLNVCLNHSQGCSRQGWCPAHTVWGEAQNALSKVLGAATIGDLARRINGGARPHTVIIDPPVWN